ncbi:Y4yA family PLP-dependent enzyme [Olivibacter sp. SDN3]|uniref:Y4yA family PLP-dependent enzyme n=1 Tax=Olivibacter sp. SDN3 TaxID=2764720 RepID=UPI001651113A|nr:Y4yA family PLP-dependent enzyme [Olivibacter sp. SDN3]QNL51761.1 Y4yA family PLP-dependent enzyme [Olivibacter sp. SDN3]
MKPETSNTGFFPLTPRIHPWIDQLTANSAILVETLERYGSPLNIHCKRPFEENLKYFREVFQEYGMQHKIYFARKANKCLSFAKEACRLGEGVDTASYRELQQCLDTGVPPNALISTAAVKNEQLLRLALANEVTVVLDNLDECSLLQSLATAMEKQVHVCLRVGGFDDQGKPLHTRFGWPITGAEQFIHTQLGPGNRFDRLRYYGLHFHLNGYSITQRVEAIKQCLSLVDRLKTQDIHTNSLDIGGGILVNYLQSSTEWRSFHLALKDAVEGRRSPLTYLNDPLGMAVIEGKAYGEPTVYPYHNSLHKEHFLREILKHQGTDGRPIAEGIRRRGLELRMEPGRSALDQCGITIARVAFRREDTRGELLVGLEMNHTQLKSSSADFLLDPIHVPKKSEEKDTPTFGFLVGSYCLEQELILKRRVRFRTFPQVGDLLIFVNTAGYMMHFYESEAHLFELAKNVFYDMDTNQIHEDALYATAPGLQKA